MNWLPWLFAILAGISNPLQSGSNSGLNKAIEAPVLAAFVVYAIGSVCLLVSLFVFGVSGKDIAAGLRSAPWWAFIGGICNALFLMVSLIVTKQLGSAAFTTTIVIAAAVTSLLLDHFGLLGFEVRTITGLRALGALMAIGGVVLITVF